MNEHLPHQPALIVSHCTPEMLTAGATAIEQFYGAYPTRQLAGAVYTAMERVRNAASTPKTVGGQPYKPG